MEQDLEQEIKKLRKSIKSLIAAEGIHRTHLSQRCGGDMQHRQVIRIKRLRELYKDF